MTKNKRKSPVVQAERQPDADVPSSQASGAVVLPGNSAAVINQDDGVARIDTTGGNPFKAMGGSDHPSFNSLIFREVLAVAQHGTDQARRIGAASAAMAGFKPTDEIEGMLAAQATAMHLGAMECFRRAMIPEQPAEIASKLRKDGANLSRALAEMLDVLDRKRGKGPQVVRVERVVVHEGGQTVVGNVTAGSGGRD